MRLITLMLFCFLIGKANTEDKNKAWDSCVIAVKNENAAIFDSLSGVFPGYLAQKYAPAAPERRIASGQKL